MILEMGVVDEVQEQGCTRAFGMPKAMQGTPNNTWITKIYNWCRG